ncbi:MAG: hypothetical protein CXX81_09500 [Methanobacteriota archaeon]|nr:MAG: hypothetical protein CXX81_09500 [Euryarchaeota archaeon]
MSRLILACTLAIVMLLTSIPNPSELPSNVLPDLTSNVELVEGETVWSETLNVRQSPFWISIDCPSESNCEELNLTVTDSWGSEFSTSGRFHLELSGNLSAGPTTIQINRAGLTNQALLVSRIFFDLANGEFIDTPSQLPNPGEDASGWRLIDMAGCGSLSDCGEIERTTIDDSAVWWNGTLDSAEDSDTFQLNASDGDVIEIEFSSFSSDVFIEIWSRSADDLQLISQQQFMAGSANPPQRLLVEVSNDEIWVMVYSSSGQAGLYSLRFASHSAELETPFGETASEPWVAPTFADGTISGHLTTNDAGGDTIRLEAGSRSIFNVDWTLTSAADIYFQARSGTWTIIHNESNLSGSVQFTVPTGADAAAITFTNASEPLIWTLTITSLGPNDGATPGDASDSHPNGEADTLDWMVMRSESGYTSGTIGGTDIRDVYLIEREIGYPYRSLLTATIESDPGTCVLKLVQLNTTAYNAWTTVSWNLTEMQGQQATTTLDLPHGRHLLVVESNISNEVEYTVNWAWLTPEGAEPNDGNWIDYSDEVGTFYIVIGFVLLSPMLLVIYWRLTSGGVLEIEAHEKRRLNRLRERLIAADPNNVMDPNALLHALESLADTDWDALVMEWGEPLTRHTTESLDLIVWGLTANEGARSITVGLRLLSEEWTLAAIRFQAVEGGEWVVTSVTPESLFDGDEVFLGDLNAKTNRFLRIDMEGDAEGFDLILSGLVGGKPVAAVPTKAVLTASEEE